MAEDWKDMNREQRLEHLQELENQNAEADGREPREVVGDDLPKDAEGVYDHENNPDQISIDNKYLDDPDSNLDNAENTVAHEGRHATQHDVVDGTIDGEQAGIDNDLKEDLAEDFEAEHDDKLDGEYKNRASERDAREYAAEKAPDSSISGEDIEYYKGIDEIDRIDAIAENSAADYEAFENGEVNQFSPGQSESYNDIIDPNEAESSKGDAETADKAEKSDYPEDFRDVKEPGADATHGEFMDKQAEFEKSVENGSVHSEPPEPPPEPPEVK